MRVVAAGAAAIVLLLPAIARAEATPPRFGAGGYFRVATRPDFQGGNNGLGYSNLYGRLMNEGPYAALEMKLDLLQSQGHSDRPWTSLHAKVEGGSIANGSVTKGNLSAFTLSQLYVEAGNVGLRDVVWRVGTLDYYFGDLGLYDIRPAEVFFDTLGASATLRKPAFDVMVGLGDSGYFQHGASYDTVFTGGGVLRARIGRHLELGGGGQMGYEPGSRGNQFAPYQTPGVTYDEYARHDFVYQYDLANPGVLPNFPRPLLRSSQSWKAVGYLGFGKMGPIQWNNLFASYSRLAPDTSYTETYPPPPPGKPLPSNPPAPQTYTIYVHDLTDQRFQLLVGDEIHFTLLPDRLDAGFAALFGDSTDGDNKIQPSDFAQTFESTVGRLQLYLTETVHLLAETSLAREYSKNGFRYRDHADSVFETNDGITTDTTGLQFGDDRARRTWQGKFGVVLNPLGYGVFTRPSLRFLYGIQYSTQNDAFGNGFVQSLDQFNNFGEREQHWHQVVGVEAEAWF